MNLAFFIPIKPEPKRRPRFARTGHAYTDARTVTYEKAIAEYVRNHVVDVICGNTYKVPLHVTLTFKFTQPKSNHDQYPTTRSVGDCDNLAKAVLDSLNEILWVDDSQIVHLSVYKVWTHGESVPGTFLSVKEMV